MIRLIYAACLLALGLSPVAGLSQTAVARPDPLNAEAAAPRLSHDSAFTAYRAFVDQEVAPWSETNHTVGRIGGWRAYAGEVRGPGRDENAQLPPPNPAPAVPLGPRNSGNHSMMHGGRHE